MSPTINKLVIILFNIGELLLLYRANYVHKLGVNVNWILLGNF